MLKEAQIGLRLPETSIYFLNLVSEHANFVADIFKYRIFDGFMAK